MVPSPVLDFRRRAKSKMIVACRRLGDFDTSGGAEISTGYDEHGGTGHTSYLGGCLMSAKTIHMKGKDAGKYWVGRVAAAYERGRRR